MEKVKSKKVVILEAQRDKKKVHFASLLDLCHLKDSELEPQFQKYKCRIVLRGDTVTDDSGANAVFTEQGSSASPNDCRKSNGCYCKLTSLWRTSIWCSICLDSSKHGGCSKSTKTFPNQNVRTYGYVFHDINCQHHGQTLKIPVVLIERNLYGRPLAGLPWETEFGWEKVPDW